MNESQLQVAKQEGKGREGVNSQGMGRAYEKKGKETFEKESGGGYSEEP